MAFERFTESGRSYKAKLSIRSNGQIGLNQGAYNRFNLGDYNYVVLFYDKDDNKIGLRFLHEMEEHALKYRNKHENISISARSFLDYYQIPYGKEVNVKKVDVAFDEDNNMLVAQL